MHRFLLFRSSKYFFLHVFRFLPTLPLFRDNPLMFSMLKNTTLHQTLHQTSTYHYTKPPPYSSLRLLLFHNPFEVGPWGECWGECWGSVAQTPTLWQTLCPSGFQGCWGGEWVCLLPALRIFTPCPGKFYSQPWEYLLPALGIFFLTPKKNCHEV